MDCIKEAAIRFCDAQRSCSDCKYGDRGADECLVMAIARAKDPECTISDVMAWSKAHKDEAKKRRSDIFGDQPARVVVAESVASGLAKILAELADMDATIGMILK